MRKLTQRSQRLTAPEQRHLVDKAIPNRIALIERCVSESSTFGRLTAAAIHARALAGFLGIGANQKSLWVESNYHNHGDGESYEVKISDIANGALFTQDELNALSVTDREAIRVGFDTINREFAHFTFWSDQKHQASAGAPNDTYILDLRDRVSRFARTIIRLLRQRLKQCSRR
jgi:hypothetical protein